MNAHPVFKLFEVLKNKQSIMSWFISGKKEIKERMILYENDLRGFLIMDGKWKGTGGWMRVKCDPYHMDTRPLPCSDKNLSSFSTIWCYRGFITGRWESSGFLSLFSVPGLV